MHVPRSRAVIALCLAISMLLPGLQSWHGAAAQVATPVVDLNTTLPVQPGGALPGNPDVQLIKVAEGLADPVNIAAPVDD